MNFYYINSANERVNFYDFPYLFQDGTILDYNWKYDNENNRISNIHKEASERTFRLALVPDYQLPLCQRKRLLLEAANRIFEVFEYDVCNDSFGRLYCDLGYYLPCKIITSSKQDWLLGVPFMFQDFTLLTQNDFWFKENIYKFNKIANSKNGGFEFPFEFPIDFLSSPLSEINLDSKNYLPSDFILTIFGECTNPSITIGNHVYKVMCKLQQGDKITVKSVNGEKSIIFYGRSGIKLNYFKYRNKTNSVFESIPPGKNKIVWNGDFSFELTVIDKRSEPKWIENSGLTAMKARSR